LQESLAHAPEARTREHVEIIASTLQLVPLFAKLRDKQIEELAAVIGKDLVSSAQIVVNLVLTMHNLSFLRISSSHLKGTNLLSRFAGSRCLRIAERRG
jgi:hypothetical protein